jgi:hypothetical protein
MNSHVAVTWELTTQNVARGYGSIGKEMNGGAQVLPSDILVRASTPFDKVPIRITGVQAFPGGDPSGSMLLQKRTTRRSPLGKLRTPGFSDRY